MDTRLTAAERAATPDSERVRVERRRAGLCLQHGDHTPSQCRALARRGADLRRAWLAAQDIRGMVEAANGSSKAPVAIDCPDDIIQAVARVAHGGGDWTAPGRRKPKRPRVGYWSSGRATVANSYGYPAYSTATDIVRVGSTVYVLADCRPCGAATPMRLSSIQRRWRDETIRDYVESAPTAPGVAGRVLAIPCRIARLLADCEGSDG